MTAMTIWPGCPSPLGATLTDKEVNFAVFSEHATKVELCLFNSLDAPVQSQRIALPENTNQVFGGSCDGSAYPRKPRRLSRSANGKVFRTGVMHDLRPLSHLSDDPSKPTFCEATRNK
jgi:pullulanase/glycogen debranching enzyme